MTDGFPTRSLLQNGVSKIIFLSTKMSPVVRSFQDFVTAKEGITPWRSLPAAIPLRDYHPSAAVLALTSNGAAVGAAAPQPHDRLNVDVSLLRPHSSIGHAATDARTAALFAALVYNGST